jgi:hypothetical protein
MVNYLYELDCLEENRANFESSYIVPVSQHIQTLLENEKACEKWHVDAAATDSSVLYSQGQHG